MNGYIQVYTGNGKGKTTAAIGLALRAAGAGLNVFIGQFMKLGDYSEINAFRMLSDSIKVEQFGRKRRIGQEMEEADRVCAQKGLDRIKAVIKDERYDLVILDEINYAMGMGLISTDKVIEIIKGRPPDQEIVLTGRDAPGDIIGIADLVTEMRMVKHYYNIGVRSRRGIER